MDSNTSQLRSFNCPIHPEEMIMRVSTDTSSKKTLFCLECIIELEKSEKSLLIDYKSLAKTLFNDLSEISSFKIQSSAPSSLTTLLEEKETQIAKFTEHIMDQKIKVCNNIKTFQDEITKKIEKLRDEMLIELDTQLVIFKKNFETYEEILKNTFSSTTEYQDPRTISELIISNLSNSRSAIELASKIKSYFLDIEDNKNILGLDKDDREKALLDSLTSYSEKIDKTIKNPVKINTDSTQSDSKTLQEFFKHFDLQLNSIASFKNSVTFLKQDLQSDLLSGSHLPFIKQIVKVDKLKLKSLYSGSASAQNINLGEIWKLWVTKSHLLCLFKKKMGNRIFGVYKERPDFNPKMVTFDLTRKFEHRGMIYGQNTASASEELNLSDLFTICLPPRLCYNGLVDYYAEQGTYDLSTEDLEERNQGGFLLDTIEILEIDIEGKNDNQKNKKLERNIFLNNNINQVMTNLAGNQSNFETKTEPVSRNNLFFNNPKV